MKLILCGGHTSGALSLADQFRKDEPGVEIVWLGRKYVNFEENKPSFEYYEVKKRKIRFINVTSGRFLRELSLRFFVELFYFIIGIIKIIPVLLIERPSLVVSFGGYIGLTVVIGCLLTGKKYVIHEQTSVPGLANRISSLWAKRVFLGFNESEKYFPIKKSIFVGNLLRQEIIYAYIKRKSKRKNKKPLLYITGGSIGSQSINSLVAPIISKLTNSFQIIHQCGSSNDEEDYKFLSKYSLENYRVYKYITSKEIESIYAKADIVLSRSGAHTVTELMVLQIPSVIIPLPWSAFNEQYKNAEILKKYSNSEIFKQPKLINIEESYKLYEVILKIYHRNYNVNSASSLINSHINSAHLLANEIKKII